MFGSMGLARPGASTGAAASHGTGHPLKRSRFDQAAGGTDNDNILRTVAELTCINSAKIRTLENHCYLTWIIPATATLFIKLIETGRAYNEKARQDKKHGMGSPHVSLAAALTEHILEAPTTPPADKEALKKFGDRHTTVAELEQSIPVVRKSLTHAKLGRVVVGLDARAVTDGIGEILKRAFTAEQGEIKIGDAPRGPKEREIAAHFNFGPESREQG